MICTFIGARDTPFTLREHIKKAIIDLIFKGINEFCVGNNGNFDYMVQSVLVELRSEYSIKFDIVLSYIDELALIGNQEFTVYPEELAPTPKRFAISKRNDYLLKKSSILIAYTDNTYSNSYKFTQKALKKGYTVINLAK